MSLLTNPFLPGDRVQCQAKNRHNGTVVYLYCDLCDKCKNKSYNQCEADQKDRNKVLASFYNPITKSSKRYRYDYTELQLEPPLPLKEQEKSYDFSPRDIRPLGSARLNIPLIVSEGDDEDNVELEEELDLPTCNQPNGCKKYKGMILDDFLTFASDMRRPI